MIGIILLHTNRSTKSKFSRKVKLLGQQQLLLITVAIIVVGIALLVSFSIYKQNSIDQNRDNVTSESLNLANMAMTYYKKPKSMGGNDRSFVGWEVPLDLVSTDSGTFTATTYSDSVIIIGTGNEIVSGYDHVKVKTIVTKNNFSIQVLM